MNYVRPLILIVLAVGLGVAFNLFYQAHNDPISSYDRQGENYMSDEYYQTILASNFESMSQEQFVEYYQEYLPTEDLQQFMTPKMLVALGSHRAGFDGSAKANYANVANEYFRDHTEEQFLAFCKECKKDYDVDLVQYLAPEYAVQLR